MPLHEEYLRKKAILSFGASDSVLDENIYLQGELMDILLSLTKSGGATSTTGTLSVMDEDGYEVFNSGAKAIGSDHLLDENRFISGLTKLRVTLDAAPGVGETAEAVVVLMYKGHEMKFAT